MLDGGLDKWKAEGRAIETGPAKGYPPATFTAKPRAGYFVDKRRDAEGQHRPRHRRRQRARSAIPQGPGAEPLRPGRPHSRQRQRVGGDAGRSASKAFLPLAEAAQKFAAQGITKDKRVVAYCGGGISATIDLLQLHRLGYDNLTLYDASMGEWAKDESLPIETG